MVGAVRRGFTIGCVNAFLLFSRGGKINLVIVGSAEGAVNRCNVEGTVSRRSLEGVVWRCSAEGAVRRCSTVRR